LPADRERRPERERLPEQLATPQKVLRKPRKRPETPSAPFPHGLRFEDARRYAQCWCHKGCADAPPAKERCCVTYTVRARS
jgi:hypothetical protein